VRIHRTAARPALQAASARAPDNETAKWALAELAAWGR
jgi:hypothetical protein